MLELDLIGHPVTLTDGDARLLLATAEAASGSSLGSRDLATRLKGLADPPSRARRRLLFSRSESRALQRVIQAPKRKELNMSDRFSHASRRYSVRLRRVIAPIAVAAVAALVGGNAFAAADAPHVTTLRYTLHFSPLTVIDVGAKGNSLGDEIVSHDIVFSKSGKGVGYDAQTCMLTNLRPPQLGCSLVFALPGGTITGQYIGAPPP